MDVQLVMPVYNEEACISDVVRRWAGQLRQTLGAGNFRMLVINDGSRDGTGAILDALKSEIANLDVIHQKNGGHGAAVLAGYRRAVTSEADWVFQTDSDDQFSPSDFDKLWARRVDSTFILGRRLVRHDALHRMVITRIAKTLNVLLFGSYVPDANIPFRLISRPLLGSMLNELNADVFAPNIFLSIMARRRGIDTLDIPVQHFERQTGVVSIVRWRLIKACLRCVRELVEFRFGLQPGSKSLREMQSPSR